MSHHLSITTKGQIDRIEVKDNRLFIFGWAATKGSGLMKEIGLTINHAIQTGFVQDLNAASPDVEQVFPDLDHTGQCRFAIHFPIDCRSASDYEDALFEITPIFEKASGWRLFYIYKPELPVPNTDLIESIGGGFHNVGIEYLSYFTVLGHLESDHTVLDAGCGVGRMAYSLAYFLDETGNYEGFDIMEDVITWAKSEISSRFHNFKFKQLPVYNHHYNPKGTVLGENLVFPYQANHFDFALLTSVFTHMQGKELRRYLSELYRVLKPGGRCLCTCFLLNQESEKLIDEGVSTEPIKYQLSDCFTSHPENPEKAIGYKEHILDEWINEAGFMKVGTYYGNWCKRKESVSFQDILVLRTLKT